MCSVFYLSYKWQLWKIEHWRAKLHKDFEEKARQLRKDKSKSQNDFAELDSEEYYETRMIDEEVNLLYSRRLLDEANRCAVEIPQGEDSWASTEDGSRNYLTYAGRLALRERIRPLKDDDFQEWSRWVPIIFGLIGALTGLFAILHRK